MRVNPQIKGFVVEGFSLVKTVVSIIRTFITKRFQFSLLKKSIDTHERLVLVRIP